MLVHVPFLTEKDELKELHALTENWDKTEIFHEENLDITVRAAFR